MGKQWDDIGHETATLDAIDPQAIRYLIHKGMAAHRISAESLGNTPAEVLENLHLTDEHGKIKKCGTAPIRQMSATLFHRGTI